MEEGRGEGPGVSGRMSLKCASAAGEFTAETQHLQESWITPQIHGDRLDFSQSSCMISVETLWRNTDSYSCHLTDVTAHKYYVVGQSPTWLQHLGMLSRCAGVLGNAGSRSGKYDCAHLFLTAVQVLAHPFTRASEVPAEYNLVALLIHCLLSHLFFCLVLHTEPSLDMKFLLRDQSSQQSLSVASGPFFI